MFLRFGRTSGLVWLGIGLAAGVVLGSFLPNTPLHAVSGDRTETFAIATGYCDEQVEAIWLLDFLTGKLNAAAVSKQTGAFNSFFTRDIAADFGIDQGKNPRFLMCTGVADLRRAGGARMAPSRSTLYVAEITTGKLAAYSLPWSASAWVSGQAQRAPIALLGVIPFRTAGVGGVGTKDKE